MFGEFLHVSIHVLEGNPIVNASWSNVSVDKSLTIVHQLVDIHKLIKRISKFLKQGGMTGLGQGLSSVAIMTIG
jgi:hypothetical protein